MPQEKGFYWAKSRSFNWYNVIVEVYGDFPFLRLRGWDIAGNKIVSLESWDINAWGPRITEPDANLGTAASIL